MAQIQRAPNEKELEKLIGIYLKAETDIINEISRLRTLGLVDYHAVAALQRVQEILRKMESDCWEYVPKMIEKMFYVRVPEARKELEAPETEAKHRAGYENAAVLTSTQTSVVHTLVQNLMGEITDAEMTVMGSLQSMIVGRIEPDVYRHTGLEIVAGMQATGKGFQAAVPQFVEQLRREGVTAFVDKAGRKWSLHTYCSMATRTTSRQAEVLAVLTADEEHDHYKISSHGTTCAICAPFEGRVYSKSGKDPDFPPLAAAFGKIDPSGPDDLTNTYLNIHPNCLHVLLPWTPAGKTEEQIQKIKDFSNPEKNPFTVDPRSQKQIDAYRKKERARARWLADYRQWEHYRMTLGDKVPKTFATFQKHNIAKDDKYKDWIRAYKEANHISNLSQTLPLSSDMSGVIPAGATIKRTRIIAGYGSNSVIRDASRLAEQYGGDSLKWEKKGGIIETNNYRYDVHWYEYEGVHYEEKVKGVKKK